MLYKAEIRVVCISVKHKFITDAQSFDDEILNRYSKVPVIYSLLTSRGSQIFEISGLSAKNASLSLVKGPTRAPDKLIHLNELRWCAIISSN